MQLDVEPPEMLGDAEIEPLMDDSEFESELALAAEGKGELFEDMSLEDFKRGD